MSVRFELHLSSQHRNIHMNMKAQSNIRIKRIIGTWESTPLQEETTEPIRPRANSCKANLTDLNKGKTEPSPAFSRLQTH